MMSISRRGLLAAGAVAGLPERMHLKLVEPLRKLFKDEVRDLGRWLRRTIAAAVVSASAAPGWSRKAIHSCWRMRVRP